MELIAQRPLQQALKARYIVKNSGYFYNALDHLSTFDLSSRVSRLRLAEATRSAVRALAGRPPFTIFTDRLAGWRGANQRRWSPIQIMSADEALCVIKERAFFRDAEGFADNYYLCDRSLRWFVVFCHHGDWHIFVDLSVTRQRAFKSWRAQSAVRSAERRQIGSMKGHGA
jgi:hypothetical protein